MKENCKECICQKCEHFWFEDCNGGCRGCDEYGIPREDCPDFLERERHIKERNNNTDRVSRNDVISICNILADKMDDAGRVAVEQVRDAVKDMRPYPYKKTCRYCTNSYDSEECYECTNNIQDVPSKDDKCEKCEHCDYYNCPRSEEK